MPDLLNIPFSDAASSGNAQTVGGAYGPFREGRALHIGPDGYSEIALTQALPATYTVGLWLRVQDSGSSASAWVLVKFSGPMQFLYLPVGSPLTSWTYVVFVKEPTRFSVYLNSTLVASEPYPPTWGQPTGWALLNDSPEISGNLSVSQLRAAPGVEQELLTYKPQPARLQMNYYLNQINFKVWNVIVSKSGGLLDGLPRKESLTADWPDYHGEIIDLSKPRFGVREINLDCFIYANGPDDFLLKLQAFLSELNKPNTQRLQVDIAEKKLFFEVYNAEGVDVKKKWNDGQMAGEFLLRLREPQPVKRVLKYTGAGLASITLTTKKVVDVHWGDSTHSYDVYGTNRTITHQYQTPGPHYIVISGVIEDVSNFVTNCEFVWNRLP